MTEKSKSAGSYLRKDSFDYYSFPEERGKQKKAGKREDFEKDFLFDAYLVFWVVYFSLVFFFRFEPGFLGEGSNLFFFSAIFFPVIVLLVERAGKKEGILTKKSVFYSRIAGIGGFSCGIILLFSYLS